MALAYVEGVPDGRALLRAGARGRGRQAARAREGRRHRRRAAGGGEPHRLAGQRRPRLRRHVPPGRHHPRRHHRGGLRGGRHLRHPAAAEGQPRRRDDHRRRLGRGHRRRHQPVVARARCRCPTTCAPRSTRSSRPAGAANNPVDLAGGETRDTIPEVLDLIAGHPDVDAVIYLGLGIQSNQAALMRSGPLLPGPRARAHRRLPRAPGRPLRRRRPPRCPSATTSRCSPPPSWRSPTPTTPGPAAVRATGRLCYATANRAVTALDHLWRHARHREARGRS